MPAPRGAGRGTWTGDSQCDDFPWFDCQLIKCFGPVRSQKFARKRPKGFGPFESDQLEGRLHWQVRSSVIHVSHSMTTCACVWLVGQCTGPSLAETNFGEIETVSYIAKGTSGAVYKARWRGMDCAVKKFPVRARIAANAADCCCCCRRPAAAIDCGCRLLRTPHCHQHQQQLQSAQHRHVHRATGR